MKIPFAMPTAAMRDAAMIMRLLADAAAVADRKALFAATDAAGPKRF